MNFTFCNSNNNNPPARTTAQEAAEQKLNILLEWPNVWIHVEQVIVNICQKFSLLNATQ